MAEMDELMKKIHCSEDQTMDVKWPGYERALNKFLMFKNKTKHHPRTKPSPPTPPPDPSPGKAFAQVTLQLGFLATQRGRGGNRIDRAWNIFPADE